MSKKARVMIAVLVATLLLAVVGTAAVMADDTPAPERPGIGGLLSRVADILGIDEDDLSDAFQQAREEMREECAASGNGTCEQWTNRFGEPRQEQCQEWNGPRHGAGHGFRGRDNGNFGTCQATGGQQLKAGSGQGTMATGFAGQGILR